jgi:hypothetical protein
MTDGSHQTSAPTAGDGADRADRAKPSVKLLISPLLRTDSGASQADRDKLVYTIDDRVAVLVELDVTHGISVARKNFLDLFTN